MFVLCFHSSYVFSVWWDKLIVINGERFVQFWLNDDIRSFDMLIDDFISYDFVDAILISGSQLDLVCRKWYIALLSVSLVLDLKHFVTV